MKINRDISIGISLTPIELADVFCGMDANEQSMFFNRISENTKAWDAHLCFQLYAISNCEILTDEARKVMKQIGEYSGKD